MFVKSTRVQVHCPLSIVHCFHVNEFLRAFTIICTLINKLFISFTLIQFSCMQSGKKEQRPNVLLLNCLLATLILRQALLHTYRERERCSSLFVCSCHRGDSFARDYSFSGKGNDSMLLYVFSSRICFHISM